MTMRIVITVVGLFLLSAISINAVSAHHSYMLTVQQLRAELTKVPSVPQKGFILIDVRSAEEHATGESGARSDARQVTSQRDGNDSTACASEYGNRHIHTAVFPYSRCG